MMSVTVRPYTKADTASAVRCLKVAFDEDPLFRAIAELSPNEWDVFADRAFGFTVSSLPASYGMTEVVVDDQTGKVVAVAAWEPASMSLMFGLRALWFVVEILCAEGFAMVMCYFRLMNMMESKRHALAPTAHHLQVLGAKFTGRGLGTQCIRVGIERANKAGVPCYLESSNPKNIPFYQRHGFRILEEVYPLADSTTGDKGPVVTLMLRPYDKDEKKKTK